MWSASEQIDSLIIAGWRGTGKTTAAKASANLFKPLEVVCGCALNCDPSDRNEMCEECASLFDAGKMKVCRVEKPFYILERGLPKKAIRGYVFKSGRKKIVRIGLLGRLNRGILMVDRINTLTKDVLEPIFNALNTSKNYFVDGNGENHKTRFKLIGTLDLEDGGLQKYLLPYIHMLVKMENIDDIEERMEITKRVMEFERAPEDFIHRFRIEEQKLHEKVERMREEGPSVQVPKNVGDRIEREVDKISKKQYPLSREAIVGRILEVVRSSAAYENRKWASIKDFDAAVSLIPLCFS